MCKKKHSAISEYIETTLEDWLEHNELEALLSPLPNQSESPKHLLANISAKPMVVTSNGQTATPTRCIKECIRLFEQLGRVHGRWEVFSSFIKMLAITISNQVDAVNFTERENDYMEAASHYSKEELDIFAEIAAQLTSSISLSMEAPCDILGPMFHEMELHNEWHGQFFTPQNICNMMAEIVGVDAETAMKKGYITVCEPACGSGAMLLGYANALAKRRLSYQNMVVSATDIDVRCVYMAYIQLSLYKIPAVVIHGDSITMDQWSCWCTPSYIEGNWQELMASKEDIA